MAQCAQSHGAVRRAARRGAESRDESVRERRGEVSRRGLRGVPLPQRTELAQRTRAANPCSRHDSTHLTWATRARAHTHLSERERPEELRASLPRPPPQVSRARRAPSHRWSSRVHAPCFPRAPAPPPLARRNTSRVPRSTPRPRRCGFSRRPHELTPKPSIKRRPLPDGPQFNRRAARRHPSPSAHAHCLASLYLLPLALRRRSHRPLLSGWRSHVAS